MRSLLLILITCAAAPSAAAQTDEPSEAVRRHRDIPGFPTEGPMAELAAKAVDREATGAWAKAGWKGPAAGVKLARQTRKPIMAFFVVSEMGKKTAEHC